MSRNGAGVYSLPAGSTVANGDTSDASDLNSPLADLEADANLARPIVAGGTGATTKVGAQQALDLEPGVDIQAYDADLAAIAALGYTSGAYLIKKTAANTYSLIALTAAGEALLDDADAAAQLVTLGAQASDATLTSLSGLSLSQGDILYATAADTLARLAKGAAGQLLRMNSGETAPEWGNPPGWTWLSAISTPSGSTPADFTIPSTASEICLLFKGTDRGTAGDDFLVRLGTASAFESSGYSHFSGIPASTGTALATAFAVQAGAAGAARGEMNLKHLGSNEWSQTHTVAHTTTRIAVGSGTKTLADVITRIRVLPSSGNWAGGSVQAGYR